MVSKDYFMVHPAFMDGTATGFQNGEWNAELQGIWIGKYETSGSNSQLKVQPGEAVYNVGGSIGRMYTNSKDYVPALKSHMLKNSEWGAIAYLAESKYGRNGTEITTNNDSHGLTGGGTGTAYYDTNKLQSSTGNEYGIYDLVGGKYERVAAYYKDLESDALKNGSSFADGTSDEYSTVYDGDDVKRTYKYGDATMETMGWNSNYARYVFSFYPYFRRGDSDNGQIKEGIFGFDRDKGTSDMAHASRLALIV